MLQTRKSARRPNTSNVLSDEETPSTKNKKPKSHLYPLCGVLVLLVMILLCVLYPNANYSDWSKMINVLMSNYIDNDISNIPNDNDIIPQFPKDSIKIPAELKRLVNNNIEPGQTTESPDPTRGERFRKVKTRRVRDKYSNFDASDEIRLRKINKHKEKKTRNAEPILKDDMNKIRSDFEMMKEKRYEMKVIRDDKDEYSENERRAFIGTREDSDTLVFTNRERETKTIRSRKIRIDKDVKKYKRRSQ